MLLLKSRVDESYLENNLFVIVIIVQLAFVNISITDGLCDVQNLQREKRKANEYA